VQTIRVLRSTGGNLPRFAEGQVVDVSDDTARLLCGLNLADVIKAIPEEPLAAVPENPTIMAAEHDLQAIKDGWISEEPEPPKYKRHQRTKHEAKE
jgi:hypothetical protein